MRIPSLSLHSYHLLCFLTLFRGALMLSSITLSDPH